MEDDWLGVFGELSVMYPDWTTPQRSMAKTTQRIVLEEHKSKDDCQEMEGRMEDQDGQVLSNGGYNDVGHPPTKNTPLPKPQEGEGEKKDQGDYPDRSASLVTPHTMGAMTIQAGWSTAEHDETSPIMSSVNATGFGRCQELPDIPGGEAVVRGCLDEGGCSKYPLKSRNTSRTSVEVGEGSSLGDVMKSTVVPSVLDNVYYTPGKQRFMYNTNDDSAAIPENPETDIGRVPPPYV